MRHPTTKTTRSQGRSGPDTGKRKPSHPPATEDNNATRQHAANAKQIINTLGCLAVPGQCVGLWVKDAQDDLGARSKHRTGYFTDFNALAEATFQYEGCAAGIYITANPIRDKALDAKVREWAWSKLSPYPGSPDNDLIYERRCLLIDIDSRDKPKDVSATEDEKLAAITKGHQVRSWLREQGWPEPLVIDSGNGMQLIYRIKLPVESPLVKQVLYALAKRFDDSTAFIDKQVSSAKTLMRLPGTWNCKGKNTKQRPHRLARIVSAPRKLNLVSLELLERVAAKVVQAQAPPPSAPSPAVDIDLQQAMKYLDKMEPALRTNSDGSSKAILAARAIVVGFDLQWDSEAAWQLLQHYNDRCKPPWDLDDNVQSQDLRRKLRETHERALQDGQDRGYLRLGDSRRHYEPLSGPDFPIAIPDYYWIDDDLIKIILTENLFPYAWGLRAWAMWKAQHPNGIVVPDVLVRLAHWGAGRNDNWRQLYRRALRNPRIKSSVTRPKKCPEDCLLRSRRVRHGHYCIEDGYVGRLNEFYSSAEQRYTFLDDIDGEKQQEYIRDGIIYRGYWPAMIFGTSPRTGLSRQQISLLMAITRELTRVADRPIRQREDGKIVYAKVPSDRPDRADIITGGLVMPSGNGKDRIVCPLLEKDEQYVGFCGNYRQHRGRGYRLYRWMERAGYGEVTPGNTDRFLADLQGLAEKFDLVVTARHHDSGKWYAMERMQELQQSRWGRDSLQASLLRIYAPADFLVRWRYKFAQWLGLGWIPGGEPRPFVVGNDDARSSEVLRSVLDGHGLTQEALAAKMGVSRESVSRNLNRRRCSVQFWKKLQVAMAQL